MKLLFTTSPIPTTRFLFQERPSGQEIKVVNLDSLAEGEILLAQGKLEQLKELTNENVELAKQHVLQMIEEMNALYPINESTVSFIKSAMKPENNVDFSIVKALYSSTTMTHGLASQLHAIGETETLKSVMNDYAIHAEKIISGTE